MKGMRRAWLPPPTIRGALFALIALAFLPLLLVGGVEVAANYRSHRDAETGAAVEAARSVATATEAFIRDLVRVEYAVGASFAGRGVKPSRIERTLARVVGATPGMRDMSWIDPRGQVVASTEPRLAGKSLFAREYFHEIAGGAEWRVSPLLRSVVDGRATVLVARGVRRPDGELVGIVVAALEPDAFSWALRAFREGMTSICDSAGTLVASDPARALEWSERRLPGEHAWVQQALYGEDAAGVFRWVNGERRVGAMVPIPGIGWVAHASRPFDAAMAPVRSEALMRALVFLAVALGGLGGALIVARRIAGPLRALEWEAARLARGGVPSPGPRGPAEVRRVAYALRSMASSVAARRVAVEALTEERETLMQTVSHDLRTPLHVIVGHARMLKRGLDADVQRRADVILSSAGRMTRLIGDLVDAARLEAGHVELRLEPMDLASFLGGWRDRVAGGLNVERVRLEVPAPLPAVLADPGRLDQILANLVSNALKYSIPGSEVRVTLAAVPAAAQGTPQALWLAVSDVGPGIPAEELPRLFERYYRSKGAAHTEGLGLGLFITRKLVEAHGWRIDVESVLGKGSVFTVVIPVSGARASSASPSAVA